MYPSPPLVNGTRYGDVFTNGSPPYANQLPSYPVLPDRPLNLDVTVNTTYRNTGDWASTRSCHPGGSPCPGREDGVVWFVSWKDVPGYRYRGRRVQYAGFGETGIQSNAAGIIEEWWFAEGIGPIYLITYPVTTLAQGKLWLYGTSVYPNPSLDQSPEAHINRRLNVMVGSLSLTSYCVDNTCSVQY
jgi:hypothetical protein